MTLTEEYKNWIVKLSEENFNFLTVSYLKEYYNTKEVNITNGPYDGGNDLVVFKNGKEIRRNIQISVQKRYENKLKEDLEKAKDNVSKYNYLKNLDFYISQKISKSKKNELIRMAEIDFDIDLKIIDANKLADDANEYTSISKSLASIIKPLTDNQLFKIDKNTKILFDVLASSNDTLQVKNNFIRSFIIYHLYENGKANVEEISNALLNVFQNDFSKTFYGNQLAELKKQDAVHIVVEKPKTYDLTKKYFDKITALQNTVSIQENELLNDITRVLDSYNLANYSSEVIEFLRELYKSNYKSDIDEVTTNNSSFNSSMRNIFNDFIKFIVKKSNLNDNDANDLARKLLVICSKNEYMNKTSISLMFTSLFKSNKLEQYIGNVTKNIFLDTQVLLQWLCYQYKPMEYDDILYNSVKFLIETIEKSIIEIKIFTTYDYVNEVAGHIFEALLLERFLNLEYIENLGRSKNVFFNYYLFYKDNYPTDFEDFSDFLDDFLDIDISTIHENKLIEEISSVLIEQLELLGISVITPPIFENNHVFKKQYDMALDWDKSMKSWTARKHDLRTIIYLSTEDFHIDTETGEFIKPWLTTWDSSFYEVRKPLSRINTYSPWQIYSPIKLANSIGVMNFKIDSNAINYNIISLVEENFNLSNDKISFIDLLNNFFHLKDLTNLKLANKFARLRKQLEIDCTANDFEIDRSKNLPIDILLLRIRNHYQKEENKYTFEQLVKTFENNSNSDKITQLIKNNVDYIISEKKDILTEDTIKEIDCLIENEIA